MTTLALFVALLSLAAIIVATLPDALRDAAQALPRVARDLVRVDADHNATRDLYDVDELAEYDRALRAWRREIGSLSRSWDRALNDAYLARRAQMKHAPSVDCEAPTVSPAASATRETDTTRTQAYVVLMEAARERWTDQPAAVEAYRASLAAFA